jgi:hypothetical protein
MDCIRIIYIKTIFTNLGYIFHFFISEHKTHLPDFRVSEFWSSWVTSLCAGRSPGLKGEYMTLVVKVKYKSLIQADGGEVCRYAMTCENRKCNLFRTFSALEAGEFNSPGLHHGLWNLGPSALIDSFFQLDRILYIPLAFNCIMPIGRLKKNYCHKYQKYRWNQWSNNYNLFSFYSVINIKVYGGGSCL